MPSGTAVTKFETSRDKKTFPIDQVLNWKFLGKHKKYSIFFDKDDNEFHLGIFKNTEFINCAQLEVSFPNSNLKRLAVDYIYVQKDYRGKKLATKLYAFLITQHDYILVSGSSQSPGGKHIWRELSKDKGVDISISNDDYDTSKASSRKFRNGVYELFDNDDEDLIDNRRFIAKKNTRKAIRYL